MAFLWFFETKEEKALKAQLKDLQAAKAVAEQTAELAEKVSVKANEKTEQALTEAAAAKAETVTAKAEAEKAVNEAAEAKAETVQAKAEALASKGLAETAMQESVAAKLETAEIQKTLEQTQSDLTDANQKVEELTAEVAKLSEGSVENLKNTASKLGIDVAGSAVEVGSNIATALVAKVTDKFNEKSGKENTTDKVVNTVKTVLSFGKNFLGKNKKDEMKP